MRVLRAFGIDIRLDLSWIVIFLLVLWSVSAGYMPERYPGLDRSAYWAAGLTATLLLFASILLHELAHALVALRNGLAVPSITLFLFGGVSQMDEEPGRPGLELKIALAGPLLSFALAGSFWLLGSALPASTPRLAAGVVEYLAFINAALGVFNLLPGFPLDGGRVLRAVLWHRTGSLVDATETASNVGKGLALGLMLLGGLQIFSGSLVGGLWLIFIGLFLRGVAEASFREVALRSTLHDVLVRDAMVAHPVTVEGDVTVSELIDEYVLGHGYRGFPVVEGDRVLGMISVDDVRKVPREERARATVADHMQSLCEGMSIRPDAPLNQAVELLARERRPRLLVIEAGQLVGLLTRSDVARYSELRRMFQSQ